MLMAPSLQAAVDMMRAVLNTVNMDGRIVIGEGEKDEVQPLLATAAYGPANQDLTSVPSL